MNILKKKEETRAVIIFKNRMDVIININNKTIKIKEPTGTLQDRIYTIGREIYKAVKKCNIINIYITLTNKNMNPVLLSGHIAALLKNKKVYLHIRNIAINNNVPTIKSINKKFK
jgi:hypothetical protein